MLRIKKIEQADRSVSIVQFGSTKDAVTFINSIIETNIPLTAAVIYSGNAVKTIKAEPLNLLQKAPVHEELPTVVLVHKHEKEMEQKVNSEFSELFKGFKIETGMKSTQMSFTEFLNDKNVMDTFRPIVDGDVVLAVPISKAEAFTEELERLISSTVLSTYEAFLTEGPHYIFLLKYLEQHRDLLDQITSRVLEIGGSVSGKNECLQKIEENLPLRTTGVLNYMLQFELKKVFDDKNLMEREQMFGQEEGIIRRYRQTHKFINLLLSKYFSL